MNEPLPLLRETIQIPPGHSFRVLRWSRVMQDAECVLSPEEVVPTPGEGWHWHFHPEMELTLITGGEGIRCVGDHEEAFAAGDLVLLGGRVPHRWLPQGESSGISIQWHFPASHPFWTFPETLPLRDLFRQAAGGLRFDQHTAASASVLLAEITGHGGAARLSLLLRLLVCLAETPPTAKSLLCRRSFERSPDTSHRLAIERSVQHLVAHFRNQVRLEDLLELTGLSRPTFSQQFKQLAGRTFSEFLKRLRLQAARRALLESRHSVLDIALTSGFSQISFFNRLFRRTYHCSPTEYRRKHLHPQPLPSGQQARDHSTVAPS
jgi:AraC-like DNA-binding protein/mannose-6-phosphate isomerase-like protein (cupin superfamily)